MVLLVLLVVGLLVHMSDVDRRDRSDREIFNHLSSAEHLRAAVEMCRSKSGGDSNICFADDPTEAALHLRQILPSAPEYVEAAKLLYSFKNNCTPSNSPLKKNRMKPRKRQRSNLRPLRQIPTFIATGQRLFEWTPIWTYGLVLAAQRRTGLPNIS